MCLAHGWSIVASSEPANESFFPRITFNSRYLAPGTTISLILNMPTAERLTLPYEASRLEHHAS